MNPFISPSEFKNLPESSYMLILCATDLEKISEYIENSYLYIIEESITEFINKAKSLELDEEKGIILYDFGELVTACKAFWAMKATGHDEVRILLGGMSSCEDYGIELVSGIPPILTQTDPYLPFNTALIIPYTDFIKKEGYYQQIIYAEKISFNILDVRKNILPEEQLLQGLEKSEIKFQNNKATIVHGKYAVLVGALLKYLGHLSVGIVLENTEGFISAKRKRKSNVKKDEDFDATNIPSSRSLPFIDPDKVMKPEHKPIEEHTRCVCSCSIV